MTGFYADQHLVLLPTCGFSSFSCGIIGKSRTGKIWELGSTKRDFPQISFKQEVVSILIVRKKIMENEQFYFKKEPTETSSGYLRHFWKV